MCTMTENSRKYIQEYIQTELLTQECIDYKTLHGFKPIPGEKEIRYDYTDKAKSVSDCFCSHFIFGTIKTNVLYDYIREEYLGKEAESERIDIVDESKGSIAWLAFDYININGCVHCENVWVSPLLAAEEKWAREQKLTVFSTDEFIRCQNEWVILLNSFSSLEDIMCEVSKQYEEHVGGLRKRIADYLDKKSLRELVLSDEGTRYRSYLERFKYEIIPVEILRSDEAADKFFRKKARDHIQDNYKIDITFGKNEKKLGFEYRDGRFYLSGKGSKGKETDNLFSETVIERYAGFYNDLRKTPLDLSVDRIEDLYRVDITLSYEDRYKKINRLPLSLCSLRRSDDNSESSGFYLPDLIQFLESLDNSQYGNTEYEHSVLELLGCGNDNGRIDISRKSKDKEEISTLFKKTLRPKCAPCGRYPSAYDPYLMQQLAIDLSGWHDLKVFTVNGPPGTGKSTLLKDITADIITRKALKIARKLSRNGYVPDRLFDGDACLKKEHEDLFEYGILILCYTNKAVENIVDDFTRGIKKYLPEGHVPCVGKLGKQGNLENYRNTPSVRKYCSKDIKPKSIGKCTKDFLNSYKELKEKAGKISSKSECSELINGYFGKDEERYTDAQRSNPGIKGNKEFNRERELLFIKAVRLLNEFAENSQCVQRNFREALDAIYYGNKPEADEERIKTLYNSLFFVSPVISSTFASISRTYRYLTIPSSLGTMIVDEAGQVSPENAAGILYRTQKAIIVGDPKQTPPVINDQKTLAMELAHKIIFNEDLKPEKIFSLQSKADSINPYGTEIGGTWVGCPLVLHSRCISPMFEISNAISYDGTMINVTGEPSKEKTGEFILDRSCWIQVRGRRDKSFGAKNYFIQRQAEVVKRLILEKFNKCRSSLELTGEKGVATFKCSGKDIGEMLYVITPFTSVASGLKNYLENYLLNRLRSNVPEEDKDNLLELYALRAWLNCSSIGTIHSFQGKEADEVILLLGCDEDTPETILSWINDNIVNVAVSRAKYRLYVVGDARLWQKLEDSPVKTAKEKIGKDNTVYLRTNRGKDLEDMLQYKDFIYYRERKKKTPGKIPLRLTAREPEYSCPKCNANLKKGKYGWYCPDRKCNMVFKIEGHPLNAAAMRSVMNGQSCVFDPNPYGNKYYKIDPLKPFRTEEVKGHKVTVFEYGNPIERESRITKKKKKAPALLSNCSSKIWEERKSKHTDYFDLMVLDALYTIRAKHTGEKEFCFCAMDILRLLSGDEDANYNSKMRGIIAESIRRLGAAESELMLIPNIRRVSEEKFIYRREHESEVFKGADDSKRYLKLPLEALKGAGTNGKAIFPMKPEWLKLKHYLVYRIALIYRMKKVKNRISFKELDDTIDPGFKENDRMKKKRFRQKLEEYLSYLLKIGYIYGYRIGVSEDNAGYFGISYIDINPIPEKGETT